MTTRPSLFSLLLASLATLASASTQAQDPTLSDGGKYSVVLDNACVRVLRYQDQPGERTHEGREARPELWWPGD